MTGRENAALGLKELIAMGVGGMIGGGIFSVLGLAVDVSGHAAPVAFLIGSVIALLAGYSFVHLALAFRSDGASFTYLERAFPERPAIAGIVGWTLVIGYVGTLALYAFTFGAYGAHLLGWSGSEWARRLLSLGALAVFLAINSAGARWMGEAEDLAVYIKIGLLAVLGAVGMFRLDASHFTPVFNRGGASAILGGALIFVAYEGFELITNAVCETRNPDRNLPRGIYGSILITSLIYVAIAVVSVGVLTPAALRAAQEYALAEVARPTLGQAGVVLVDLAALLATSSAINATLFGAARMARQMAVENIAPRAFSFRNHEGAPVEGMAALAFAAGAFTLLGGLEAIAAFSSMTFLMVSTAISIGNLRLWRQTRSQPLAIVLSLTLSLAAVALLALHLARSQPATLAGIAIACLATGAAHAGFERLRRRQGSSS